MKSYDVPAIQNACEILRKNPCQRLTISALALEVGLNYKKLNEGFKAVYQETIHQFRRDLRLREGKQLLDDTDMTVAEIAYKLGFDSRDGFSRSFRKKYHRSPMEWRKEQDFPRDLRERGRTMIALGNLALN